MIYSDELKYQFLKGDQNKVKEIVQLQLDNSVKPNDIINFFLSEMQLVGHKFKNNEIFIPEVLKIARAMNSGMNTLKHQLLQGDIKYKGKAVIGTVLHDLHDIGKNMVIMMLEGAGFEVIDLGIDLPHEKFLEAVIKHKPDILGMSSLLTTTLKEAEKTIELLVKEGYRDKVKIMVGGAPVTEKFARDIGADGYALDAASGAEVAVALLTAKTGEFIVRR